MPTTKKVKKRRVLNTVIITIAVLFELCAASFISCLLIFYGPFPVVRKFVVNTAITSYRFQFIPHIFLSQAQILAIQNIKPTQASSQNMSGVVVTHTDKSIHQYQVNSSGYKGYMLVVDDPKRLRIGYTSQLGVQGERTSQIAKEHSAVAAINGGGFFDKSTSGKLWAGTGSYPSYFLIANGQVVFKEQNFSDDVAKNVVAFDMNGHLIVGNHSINNLKTLNVMDALVFEQGPVLLVNGKYAFSGDGGGGITARTAIGQKSDGSIILLVLDGRHAGMPGASLHDVQKIMYENGAVNATELDGGSSSTMYYNGQIINDPCDFLGERSVASAIYVTP